MAGLARAIDEVVEELGAGVDINNFGRFYVGGDRLVVGGLTFTVGPGEGRFYIECEGGGRCRKKHAQLYFAVPVVDDATKATVATASYELSYGGSSKEVARLLAERLSAELSDTMQYIRTDRGLHEALVELHKVTAMGYRARLSADAYVPIEGSLSFIELTGVDDGRTKIFETDHKKYEGTRHVLVAKGLQLAGIFVYGGLVVRAVRRYGSETFTMFVKVKEPPLGENHWVVLDRVTKAVEEYFSRRSASYAPTISRTDTFTVGVSMIEFKGLGDAVRTVAGLLRELKDAYEGGSSRELAEPA